MKSLECIMSEIESLAVGTGIPKPNSQSTTTIAGWGTRRGERALIYAMKNHKDSTKPYKKGVTILEMQKAYEELQTSQGFSRKWFKENMPACSREAPCNYTTIGGLFELVGVAEYAGSGTYRLRNGSLK